MARPIATESDENRVPGLSSMQIAAAGLLLSGRSVEEVADKLGVHRSTIWKWRSLETFEAYYNGILQEMKAKSRETILSLHEEALETLRRLLTEGSDAIAFKAASLVLSKVEEQSVGPTDPKDLIRNKCSTDSLTEVTRLLGPQPDMEAYAARCEELGIVP